MNTSINLQLNLELKKELKKDFLLRVNNILTPILLEGLQQLYNDAKNATEDKNKVLAVFQSLLKRIPNWEFDTLNREVQRIHMKTAKQYPYFPQLLQTLYSLSLALCGLSSDEIEKYNIKFSQFIHKVYIECARSFYLDPFLFYHNYTQFEQKKNYYEIVNKINTAIESTLRELLPIQSICDKLGVPVLNSNEMETKDLFDMDLLLGKVIDVLKTPEPPVNHVGGNDTEQPIVQQKNDENVSINKLELDNQFGGTMNDSLNKNVNEQILDIMKKNNVFTDSNENHFTVNNHTNENHYNDNNNNHNNHNSSSTMKRVIQDSRRQSQNTISARQEENSEMKNKILKELDTETVQQHQDADNFQDVYSNSDMKANNSINTNEKNEKKSRDKFFNNYLNI
jgi:hypothetical protein